MAIKPNEIALCNVCGTISTAKRRGSGGIELLLWLCFLWPIAAVYSIWRSGGGNCPACGSTALIPATSPKVRNDEQTNEQISRLAFQAQQEKEQQARSDARIWKLVGAIIVVLLVIGIAPSLIDSEHAVSIALGALGALWLVYKLSKAKQRQ